jgi:hypothetical protein
MKLIQWGFAAAVVAGLGALTTVARAEQQGQPQPSQPPQEQPLHGKVEMTEIGLGQTPPAVRSAIEKWANGAQIKKVQEVRQGTKIQYKAEIERKGENLEVLLNEQGQVLRSGKDVGVDDGLF